MLLPVSNHKKGASGPFAVTDLPNLELWLDASDTDSITHAANAVSQWDDKSGQGNHATQGTGSAQPTTGSSVNSLNAIDFDGSTDWMNLPDNLINATAITIFMAFLPHTTDTDQIFANRGTGSNNDRSYGGNQWTNLGNANLNRVSKTSDVLIRQVSWCDGATGTVDQFLRINDESELSGTITRAEPNSNFTLGSYDDGFNGFYDGLLCEIAVCAGDVGSTHRDNMMTYLERWVATVDNVVNSSDNVVNSSDNVVNS